MRVFKNSPRWRLLSWLTLPILLLAAWALFRMFEPVLSWSSGWQPLPTADTGFSDQGHFADPAWASIATQADAHLSEARKRLQAPAISAAIMVDGHRVWAAATGFADIAQSRVVDLDSGFRLGSSSKPINALAMGRLMDNGTLDIDRSVRHYLPDLPETYEAVTTRLAISHTAGVPDYGICLCFPIWEHKNRRHFAGVRDALRVFENRPLLFVPGDGFKYSSFGTNVAGAVVESVAGRPFLDVVDDLVFKPLQMKHSSGDVAAAPNPRSVVFYEVVDGNYKRADPVDNSIRYPSGGLLSTPSDMLKAGNAFLGDDLLSKDTRQRLLTRQKLRDGSDNPQGYALGIRVFDDKKLFNETVQTNFYSHHGTAVGSTSYFGVYPEFGLVISLMMNKGQESVDAMAVEANRLSELFIAEQIRRKRSNAASTTAQ